MKPLLVFLLGVFLGCAGNNSDWLRDWEWIGESPEEWRFR